MAAPGGRKVGTRERLVRAGGALAKTSGFAASGVDALAAAAGLTSGAFYKHFSGKDALLSAICDAELAASRGRFARLEPRARAQLLRAVDAYLSLAHVRSPGAGCPLPALSAEIGRASADARRAFEDGFEQLVSVLAEKVGGRAVASALVTQCAGAVLVARALGGERAQREVLSAARESVRRLLDGVGQRGAGGRDAGASPRRATGAAERTPRPAVPRDARHRAR